MGRDPFRSAHRSDTVTLVVHGVPVDDRRNRKGTSTEGRGTSKEGRSHSPGGGVRPIVRTTNTVSTAVTRWPVRHGSARDVPSETPRGWRACPLVTRGLRLLIAKPRWSRARGPCNVTARHREAVGEGQQLGRPQWFTTGHEGRTVHFADVVRTSALHLGRRGSCAARLARLSRDSLRVPRVRSFRISKFSLRPLFDGIASQ